MNLSFFLLALVGVTSVKATALRSRSLQSACIGYDDLGWTFDDCSASGNILDAFKAAVSATSTCSCGTLSTKNCAKLHAGLLTGNMKEDGTPNWSDAKKDLATECVLRTHERCIETGEFAYGLTDPDNVFDYAQFQFDTRCTAETVVYDVEYRFNMSDCNLEPNREELLANEVLYWGQSPNFDKATSFLIETCRSLRTQCLVDAAGEPLEMVDIDWNPVCKGSTIIADLNATLNASPGGCQHGPVVEALLISDLDYEEDLADLSDSKQVKAALNVIKDKCKSTRGDKGCVPGPIDLYLPCTASTVVKNVKNALKPYKATCGHSHKIEAQIYTNTDSFDDAKLELVSLCQATDACLNLDDLDFANCTSDGFTATIQEALDALPEPCVHTAAVEKQLLTGASSAQEANRILINTKCTSCLPSLDFDISGCSYRKVKKGVQKQLKALDEGCSHDAETELVIHTSYTTESAVKAAVELECDGLQEEAVNQINANPDRLSAFADISTQLTDGFMTEYVEGGTFLNSETGNFRGKDQADHPTKGDGKTREIGQEIKDFKKGNGDKASPAVNAKNSVMQAGSVEPLQNCDSQAIMCCFGRDRQSNDNNGNCGTDANPGCNDADPGDNTDICKAGDKVYDANDGGENDEGAVHCHGLVWADSLYDASNLFRINNFFYVSLYDHMYTRGYVEKSVDEADFMCSCIEDVGVIASRSDCTQIEASWSYHFAIDSTDLTVDLSPSTSDDNLNIKFQSCQGVADNGDVQNNDLAARANLLNNYGLLNDSSKAIIDSILIDDCDNLE